MTTPSLFVAPPRDPKEGIDTSSDSGVALRPLRVGLIGFGTVGRGFCDLLTRGEERLVHDRGLLPKVTCVLVRDASRDRGGAETAVTLTADPDAFLAQDYDVVVEATGAVDGIESVVRSLLARGTPVVTANKALVAERGSSLARLAAETRTPFRFEASVAAGIPLFQILERSLQSTRFRRLAAILNGTSNFVLTRLGEDSPSVEAALNDARRLGFAEPDPADDISGIDAARKLAILAGVLGSYALSISDIETRGIAEVRPEDCAHARAFGYRLKPLAVAELGALQRAWVGPALVPAGHPLAAVENESNGIHLAGDTVAELFVSGPGAGAEPTAAALLDDVLWALDGLARGSVFGRRPEQVDGDRSHGVVARDDSWFLALSFDPGAIDPDDVIEFVAASGLAFIELRRLAASKTALTIAGITRRATRERVEALSLSLRKVPAVRDTRAFRVLDREGQR